AQVGVASLVVACLWEHLLDRFEPGFVHRNAPADEVVRREIDTRFRTLDPSGAVAGECWSDYQPKLAAWRAGTGPRRRLATPWNVETAALAAELCTPRKIAAALTAAGAPRRFSELDPPVSAERARWAIASCRLMRSRFSIADLAYFAGRWADDDVNAV